MAPLIYLDTRVVAWMFAGRTDLIPESVRALLDQHELMISPAVELELQYLFEIRRTAEPAKVVVKALGRGVGLKVCDLPFPKVVEVALGQSWTRDPFDRLIVSQATLRGIALISKDELRQGGSSPQPSVQTRPYPRKIMQETVRDPQPEFTRLRLRSSSAVPCPPRDGPHQPCAAHGGLATDRDDPDTATPSLRGASQP